MMNAFSSVQKAVSGFLKAVVFAAAALGVFLSAYAGRGSFMGGSRVFMYFTIQSNIAVALICAAGMRYLFRKDGVPAAWWIIKLVGTVSITLTGAVFCFVLAPTMGDGAWNIQNILTHVLVPIAAVLDFFAVSACSDLKKRHTLWVTIPPILYAVYAGIGYVCGWQFAEGINYPYFFLNWGSPAGAFGFTDTLPYMGCVWWILALLVALLIVGWLYLLIADVLKKLRK